MEIRLLEDFATEDIHRLLVGYSSPARYVVHQSETPELTAFSLKLLVLEQPYVKHWSPPEASQIQFYRTVLQHGLSFGAYDEEFIVGIAIAEPHTWNNSVWVWEFHIDPNYRGRGIGSQLMEHLARKCRDGGYRIMICETQSTNVPAIRFYRKMGYTLEGVDLSYYTNQDYPDGEIALFMKRKL